MSVRPFDHDPALRRDTGVVVVVEELSLVALTRAVVVPGSDDVLPLGAAGTVVAVLGDGRGYVVEFTEPLAALVDLDAADLAAVPGASHADFAARRLAHRAS